MATLLYLLLLGVSTSIASPTRVARQQTVTAYQTVTIAAPTSTAWNVGSVTKYPIHTSCNHTERAQIERGLDETIKISAHARDHILRWGNSSKIYQKYFGNAATGEPIGWYEKVVNGDKAGILFRCDNPDGNCGLEGYAGHWRGSNATSETVICPLSYQIRRPLEAMCGLGYTVANSKTNFYWASDLLHRLFHVPKVGEGAVEHFAGTYGEVLSLARTAPEEAVRNSDTLQYFALEAYAYDIAVPSEGCPGKWTSTSSAAASSQARTSSATVSQAQSITSQLSSAIAGSQTTVPSTTVPQAQSVTSAAAKECHTHSDGVVHCS